MKSLKKTLTFVPLFILAITLVGAIVAQIYNKPVLAKSDLHSQLTEFQSFDNETCLLIEEYQKDKITFIYLSEQIGQIQKQILSAGEIYNSSKIGTDLADGVKKVNNLAVDYATDAQIIELSNGDKEKISEAGNDIKKIDKQINELIKKYE